MLSSDTSAGKAGRTSLRGSGLMARTFRGCGTEYACPTDDHLNANGAAKFLPRVLELDRNFLSVRDVCRIGMESCHVHTDDPSCFRNRLWDGVLLQTSAATRQDQITPALSMGEGAC